jgi:hypothetical protein
MTLQVDVLAEEAVTPASSAAIAEAARARATSVPAGSPSGGGPVTDEFQALCEEWLPCMYDWRAPVVPARQAGP